MSQLDYFWENLRYPCEYYWRKDFLCLFSILLLQGTSTETQSPSRYPFPFSFPCKYYWWKDSWYLFTLERRDLEVEPQLDDILQGDTLDAPHAPLYQTLKRRKYVWSVVLPYLRRYLSNFVVKTWRPFDFWRWATSSTKRQDNKRSEIIISSFLLMLDGRWHLPFLA